MRRKQVQGWLLGLWLLLAASAAAWGAENGTYTIVQSCNSRQLFTSGQAGQNFGSNTVDLFGNLCVSGGSGGSSSNTNIVSPIGANTKAQSVSVAYATDQLLPAFASTPSFNLASPLPAGTNNIGSVTALPSSTTGSISAVTVGTTSAQAAAAQTRKILVLDNESTTATLACAFGAAASINTAGSFTIPPQFTRTWTGSFVPSDTVNCVASAANAPLTLEQN